MIGLLRAHAWLRSDAFLQGTLRRALKPGGFVAVNAIGRRDQWAGYIDQWATAGFSPVYILDIDPNIVFFAWKSEVGPNEPADNGMAEFFEQQDKAKTKSAVGDTVRKADQAKSPCELQRCLMTSNFGWQELLDVIALAPPLERLSPSIIGPVIKQTKPSE